MNKGTGPLANAELCTQCGYCLPVCPTYRVENNEMHSPRGRVSIVLALQAGTVTPEEAATALDHCLLCRACHNACPAGVRPAKLAMLVRRMAPPRPSPMGQLLHRITNSAPWTARFSTLLGLYQHSGAQAAVRRLGLLRPLPALARLEALLPRYRPGASIPPFPSRHTAIPGVLRVGLLSGCMGRLFMPGIAPSSGQLLAHGGREVVPLEGFGCCGAPFREGGDKKAFLRQARRTLDAFLASGPLQAVVCDSSVCAVTIKGYGHALADDATYATPARNFSAQVHTLSQFLAKNPACEAETTIDPGFGSLAYIDHCQTRFGLGIINEPRFLLASLPVVCHELWQGTSSAAEGCCGAGGDYQLRHPERSQEIRAAQLAALCATGVDTVVGENPGCLMNIAAGLEHMGSAVQVRHLAEVLWAAHSLQQPTIHKVHS
ncbi:MAG: (Fe-S)-binding protein [Magnetococcus sp. MYC-9]